MMMHLDLNSCFATIEQQANPLLRGKPVAVAAYTTPGGCILAPSIEAKRLGIKTGMRVREGKEIYPKLIVLPPDPNKYRFINRKLFALLQEYSNEVFVRSIDEMVIDFSHLSQRNLQVTSEIAKMDSSTVDLKRVAREIKQRIKKEIGEWLVVSIGIGPNRFWAKLASSLEKPDGLVEVNFNNMRKILSSIQLSDIQGIKQRNILRLNNVGIDTPLQFYEASIPNLKRAFGGIVGYYWYLKLHGFEINNITLSRKSFGNSYALYKATNDIDELSQILCKLVEKMGARLRKANYTAQGIHVSCLLSDYSYWHRREKTVIPLYTNSDLYKEAQKILLTKPKNKLVRILAVSCHYLQKNLFRQTSLLTDEIKKQRLTQAIDEINDRYGAFVVYSARMMGMENKVLDRIAFGNFGDGP